VRHILRGFQSPGAGTPWSLVKVRGREPHTSYPGPQADSLGIRLEGKWGTYCAAFTGCWDTLVNFAAGNQINSFCAEQAYGVWTANSLVVSLIPPYALVVSFIG
jgi:hypothetical protein